jgi:predicted permease
MTEEKKYALLAVSMSEYLTILGDVLPILLLMAVGAIVRRQKVLNEQADRTLLDLTVHVLAPCLILDHVVANEALRRWGILVWSPLIGFVLTAGSIGLCALAARWWGFPHVMQRRTFAFVAGICNYGYITVPLVDVLYGSEAVGVLFLVNLGTEVAFWTVGFASFQGHSLLSDWRRTLTTPVRAILLGVTVNLVTASLGILLNEATLDAAAWGWPVKILLTTIHYIGQCSIPLALLLIGATMADFWGDFSRTARRGLGAMGLSIVMRNAVCPLAYVLLAWLLPVPHDIKATMVVLAAMPAGVLTLVLCRHHGGSVPVALQVIFSTSAVSIITLPLWIHFGMALIGGK